METFNIDILITVLTTVLGFIFGLIKQQYSSNKDNYSEQLNKVFSPMYRELFTYGIDYSDFNILIDKIYRIAYENHQLIPSELMENIITLKVNSRKQNEILSETKEFKFIFHFVNQTYIKMQVMLRKNQNIFDSNIKRFSSIIEKISNICYMINLAFLLVDVLNMYYNFINSYIFLSLAIFNWAMLTFTFWLRHHILQKERKALEMKLQWIK